MIIDGSLDSFLDDCLQRVRRSSTEAFSDILGQVRNDPGHRMDAAARLAGVAAGTVKHDCPVIAYQPQVFIYVVWRSLSDRVDNPHSLSFQSGILKR